MYFYWDDWNREHATSHGVSLAEIRFVVRRQSSPDPTEVGNAKLRVWGPTGHGRLIQVIYSEISSERIHYDEMDFEDIIAFEVEVPPYIYVIHARDLTRDEKRLYHRRRR
jgi:uncharacterized DUF497 family protein